MNPKPTITGKFTQQIISFVVPICILFVSFLRWAANPVEITTESFIIWGICGVIFVTAHFFEGYDAASEISLIPYACFSLLLTWLITGLLPAVLLLAIGTLFITLPRRSANRLNMQTKMLTLMGVPLVLSALIYTLLDGKIPLTQSDAHPVAMVLSVMCFYIALRLIIALFKRSADAPLMISIFSHDLIHDSFVLGLAVLLALVYDTAGLTVFLVLLLLIGTQIARQYEINVTRQNLSRRLQELSLLNRVGQSISASLVMEDVLQSMYDRISELLDTTLFYVGVSDNQTEVVQFALVYEEGQKKQWERRKISADPFISYVLTQQTVLYLDRTLDEDRMPMFRYLPSPHQSHISIGVPLMTGSKLLGVIGISLKKGAPPPGKVELETLETICNQASLAIRNAILYDRTVQLAQNLTQINQSVQNVMFNLDSNDAVQAACDTAMRIVKAQKAAIFLADQENKNHVQLTFEVGLTPEHRRLYNGPIHRPDIFNVEPRIVADINSLDERDALVELAAVGSFNAMAEIPLRSGNALIGLLAVFHDEPHRYHETELELLGTLAYQLTAAIDYTELLAALETYASEQAQLVHLSRITMASLQLEQVIEGVGQMLQQMIVMSHVAVGLLSSDRSEIQLYDSEQPDAEIIKVQAFPELTVLFRQSQPVPRIYKYEEPGLSSELSRYMQRRKDQLLAIVPMIANNDVLGVVFLGNEQLRSLTDGDWRLIEMATNQVAAQIHNARLYRNTEEALNRRLQQLTLIEEIAQQISRTLNLEQLIHNVLEAAIMATQAEVAVLALNMDESNLRMYSEQLVEGQWYKHEFTRNIDEGVIGQVLRDGTKLVISENRENSYYRALPVFHREYRSSMIVPLQVDRTMMGVLEVESVHPDFFNDERIQFIENLAGHAVLSIQNARLLQERQSQIDTLTRLRELSLRLSTDPLKRTVTTEALLIALAMLPGHHASMYAYDKTTDTVKLLANSRRDERDDIEPSLIPHPLLLHVIHSEEAMMVSDVRQDPFFEWIESPEDVDYSSLIVAPIKYGSDVKELLCVAFARPRPLLDQDLNAIQLLAIQVAGHMENASLYEQVVESNNRIRAILDSARDGIVMLDRDGKLIEANVQAEDMLGISLEEYHDQNFAETLLNNQTDVPEQNRALTEMARALRLEPQRITNRSFELHTGGKARYIEEVGSPVLDNRRQIIGRLLTFSDITEQILLSNYRDEISQMVVHDLRGPLGSIISSITLTLEIISTLDDQSVVEPVTAVMEVSLDSAVNLLQLVDSLLDIAKLEMRRMPLKRTATSVRQMIHSAFLTLLSSIQEAEIIVDVEAAPDLPDVDVDSDKIRRVIINLLDNAIRYSPSGSRVLISAVLVGSQKVVVRIADSGKGIPPDEADRVFEKFSQIKSNIPARGRKGSGLGLTFCKLALEAHDETIWVEQNGPLPGACFAFTLPVYSDSFRIQAEAQDPTSAVTVPEA